MFQRLLWQLLWCSYTYRAVLLCHFPFCLSSLIFTTKYFPSYPCRNKYHSTSLDAVYSDYGCFAKPAESRSHYRCNERRQKWVLHRSKRESNKQPWSHIITFCLGPDPLDLILDLPDRLADRVCCCCHLFLIKRIENNEINTKKCS